jgi:hypothetical protein
MSGRRLFHGLILLTNIGSIDEAKEIKNRNRRDDVEVDLEA